MKQGALRALAAVTLIACSAGGDRPLRVGREPDDGSGGRSHVANTAGEFDNGSSSSAGGRGGVRGTEDAGGGAFTVHVEDRDAVAIEVITLACAGDCADVQAVARGGNPPYTFAWQDGATDAARHVCLDADATLSVSARDTAIATDEFHYDARSATAEVSARVLDCHWQECETSPDIWDESQSWTDPAGAPAPSEGSTYLALYNVLGKRESVSQQLCAPLLAGHTYSFQLDVAFRSEGSVFASTRGALEIWAGHQACGADQLVFTSPIGTPEWQTHCVTFTPQDSFDDLLFVAAATSDIRITGVFVDDVVPVDHCPP